MKCVDCHFLSIHKEDSRQQPDTMFEKVRTALRKKRNILRKAFSHGTAIDVICAKRREFFNIWDNDFLEKVLLERECNAYQRYDPTRTIDQILQTEVQMPIWYKIAIIATLILAAIAVAVSIWQAIS